MFEVTIKNEASEVTHSARFETRDEADAWVSSQRVTTDWGKPERWVSDLDIDWLGEDRTLAQDTEERLVGGIMVMFFKFPESFTVDIQDITETKTLEDLVAHAIKSQNFGNHVLAVIKAMVDAKGQGSAYQLQLILDDRMVAQAERLLRLGAIESCKALIQTMPETFFSRSDLDKIVGMMDQFLSQNGV